MSLWLLYTICPSFCHATSFCYSFLSHKEFRFIFPVLPLAMYQCGLYLHSITHASPHNEPGSKTTTQPASQPTSCTDHDNHASHSKHNSMDPPENSENDKVIKDNKSKVTEKKKMSGVWKSNVILSVLIMTNLPVALYTCLLHQRGTIDVMTFVQEETKYEQVNYNTINVMFLMPCHSTPFYR